MRKSQPSWQSTARFRLGVDLIPSYPESATPRNVSCTAVGDVRRFCCFPCSGRRNARSHWGLVVLLLGDPGHRHDLHGGGSCRRRQLLLDSDHPHGAELHHRRLRVPHPGGSQDWSGVQHPPACGPDVVPRPAVGHAWLAVWVRLQHRVLFGDRVS